MKAVVVTAPREVGMRDVSAPVPDGRALVRVREVGICGYDLKIMDGSVQLDHPRIIGHEMAGDVVAQGARGQLLHVLPDGQSTIVPAWRG